MFVQVEGQVTGFGNPTWRSTHPPATSNATAVQVFLELISAVVAANRNAPMQSIASIRGI